MIQARQNVRYCKECFTPVSYTHLGAAASLSGCLDIIEDVGRHLEGDSRDAALFRGIYGSLEQLEGSDNDLMALAKKLKTSGKPIPRLYSWCGTEDFLYEGNKRAWAYMKELGYEMKLEAVSYTHLDVYKRQHYSRYATFPPAGGCFPFVIMTVEQY